MNKTLLGISTPEKHNNKFVQTGLLMRCSAGTKTDCPILKGTGGFWNYAEKIKTSQEG